MAYRALLEYVRRAKDFGASDVEIGDRLRHAGWYRVDIDDALALYRRLTVPLDRRQCESERPPRPSMIERVVPHHYDPRAIAIACISFVLGFLGYMFFAR